MDCVLIKVLSLALLCLAASTAARHPDMPLPSANAPHCQNHNLRLSSFLKAAEESGQPLLPHSATSLEEFALEVKDALDKHMLNQRPIEYLFSDHAAFNPTCSGIWAEFGVAHGDTVNLAARFRHTHCSQSCPHVHGFDTFTGLPERWVRDDSGVWEEHTFDQGGNEGRFPEVEANVHLVKGLFNNSLPEFLASQSIYAGPSDPVSYLHVDCDLYAGARDALNILSSRIVAGSVLAFDDLINYQYFLDHEIKALWEWVEATGARLVPVGALGPLPGADVAMQLDWRGHGAAPWFHQSAIFVVARFDAPRAGI